MKHEPLRRLGTPLPCARKGLQEAPGPDLRSGGTAGGSWPAEYCWALHQSLKALVSISGDKHREGGRDEKSEKRWVMKPLR